MTPTDEQLRAAWRALSPGYTFPVELDLARAWWSAIAPIVRDAVLEEAAVECEYVARDAQNTPASGDAELRLRGMEDGAYECATRIRAVKGKP